MTTHDELRERLARNAGGMPVGPAPMPAIERRGAARRVRRVAGTAVAAVAVAAAVVLPLVALFAVGGERSVTHPGDGGAQASRSTVTPADPTQNVLSSARCEFDGSEFDGAMLVGFMLTKSEGDPLELCSTLWRTGDLKASGAAWASIAEGAEFVPHDSVPPLVECATFGGVRVIPSDDPNYCDAHGMWQIPPDYRDTIARWNAVETAIERRAFPGNDGSCTDPSTAAQVVREELAANGFTAWEVVDNWRPGSPNGECADRSVNFGEMRVTLVNGSLS
jgi:hypothetical protein